MRLTNALFLAVPALLLGTLAACSSAETAPQPEPAPQVAVPATPTLDDHGFPVGLHNYHVWSEKVRAGAQPEGEEAFRNMAALGIKYVLSVDGAMPDVETAAKYGIKYMHVPIEYSGITAEQQNQIVKAVAMVDAPIYIHCHHGKHRSAGASAVACVAVEGISNERVQELMKLSGTDPKYQGLWKLAKEAQPWSAERVNAIPAEIPSQVKPGGVVDAMLAIDQRWDYLKASKKLAWGLLPDHPDVNPPHEARMVWEHYREMARLDDPRLKEEPFAKYTKDAELAGIALEEALRAGDKAAADKHFDTGAKLCSSCHAKYRDN